MQPLALEARQIGDAGWSSPVARQAHNLKVVGSNPTPATSRSRHSKARQSSWIGGLLSFWSCERALASSVVH